MDELEPRSPISQPIAPILPPPPGQPPPPPPVPAVTPFAPGRWTMAQLFVGRTLTAVTVTEAATILEFGAGYELEFPLRTPVIQTPVGDDGGADEAMDGK